MAQKLGRTNGDYLVAVKLSGGRNEIFAFPTKAKMDSFTKELRKRKVSYATSKLSPVKKKKKSAAGKKEYVVVDGKAYPLGGKSSTKKKSVKKRKKSVKKKPRVIKISRGVFRRL